jgi:transcriptional regulator
LPTDFVSKLALGIVAFEMPITSLEGKWKLSQNRPPVDISGATAGLRSAADPLGAAVADLMDSVNSQ